mgnify:CR=1 FL=1
MKRFLNYVPFERVFPLVPLFAGVVLLTLGAGIIMMNGGFATNIMSALYDHAKHNDNECSSHVMNSNNGSCMAIYLGMAMEMP